MYDVWLVTRGTFAERVVHSAYGSKAEAEAAKRALDNVDGMYGSAVVVRLEADDLAPIMAIGEGHTVTTWDD